MISSRSVWVAVIVSPMLPSDASRIGPIAPSPSGLRTTAPAPSPNSDAVRLSSMLVTRLSVSARSEEHTSELQSHSDLVCRLLLEKKKKNENHYAFLKKKKK